MNINRTIISGRLAKDPEFKSIGERNLCRFRLASNRIVGRNKVEKSVFIDVDAWGGQADPCHKYLSKGSPVIVEGVLCQDFWEDQSGNKNSKTYIEADSVVFLNQGNSQKQEAEKSKAPIEQRENTPKAKEEKQDNYDRNYDEELPF